MRITEERRGRNWAREEWIPVVATPWTRNGERALNCEVGIRKNWITIAPPYSR